MKYIYGMRLRGFSPMCQPKGVVERRDDPTGKYYDLIVYNRGLTHEELEDYELDYVGTEGKEMEEKVLTYIVSFQHSENVFCTNLVIGTYEAVKKEYLRYPWYSIKEASTWQIEDAKRKGMSIIKL